jgi:ATP-binding cassette subfamily C protein
MFGLFIASLLTFAMLAVQGGGITTGGILLSINGFGMIMGSLHQMAESFPAVASVRSVFLSMEENLENKELSVETDNFDGFDGELVFEEVSFAYGDNQVLQDACFTLRKGGKYLMIGPSGGGKSTILRLVRKYFNPDRGAVLVDGVNLVDIRRESYFRHIANVEQQVFLFEDTLRNNLTLYKDYSEEDIMRAIDGAGLSDYLERLPDGLEHIIVDNGKNLSGGERARVAIARGLIARADLLLLDEAFASLDEQVARSIEKTLLSLDGVTVLSVSHVLFPDTMPLYDAVFEVKRGQVTELRLV